MTIYKIENYVDEVNRTVFARKDVDTEKVDYFGSYVFKTNQGPFPVQFPFEGEDLTLEKCFETFDEKLKDFAEKKAAEERSRIVTPDEVVQQ
jgi:hypothetical protein